MGHSLSDDAAYQLGLREYSKRAGVTTLVTSEDKDEESVLERISSLPPGVVNVETECRLEVEERISEEGESGSGKKEADGESEETKRESADLGLWRMDSIRRSVG